MKIKKDNSGNWNSGEGNSGDWNSGDWNSGNRNSGEGNSGNRNSGRWNSGDGNSGKWNSGDWNSGKWNSGEGNSGNRNSGRWNSGNNNSGSFNTQKQQIIFLFNKPINKEEYSKVLFPKWFNILLREWVNISEMTTKEKQENKSYEITKGYLKKYNYKQAWKNALDDCNDQSDLLKTMQIPNFNWKIFTEITGITQQEFFMKQI